MSLSSTLQTEREAFSRVHGKLQTDSTEMVAYIVSKVEQLQQDLATENTLMDTLSQKNEKVKVLSVKLSYATKRLDHMELEKVVFQSSVSNINQYLYSLIETRDSMLMVSVCQHLSEKLKPMFAMLNQLQGVLESSGIPKQGGEAVKEEEQPKPHDKKPTDPQHEDKKKDRVGLGV